MVLAMFPGAVEIVQDTLHFALEGHTEHDEAVAHHDEGASDEHSCSGSYHVCVCCANPHFVAPVAIHDIGNPVPQRSVTAPSVDTPVPSEHLSRLFRPPTV